MGLDRFKNQRLARPIMLHPDNSKSHSQIGWIRVEKPLWTDCWRDEAGRFFLVEMAGTILPAMAHGAKDDERHTAANWGVTMVTAIQQPGALIASA